MSDQPTGDDRTKRKTSPLRIVLLIILGVLLVALAYDRLWAGKKRHEAFQKVETMVDQDTRAGVAVPRSTDEDVHKALARRPDEVLTGKTSPKRVLEIYRWRRGLPFLTYELFVVYKEEQRVLRLELPTEQRPDESIFPGLPAVFVDDGSGSLKQGGEQSALSEKTALRPKK